MRTVRRRRRGATLVLAAVLLSVMLAVCAFAVDIGYICYWRTKCQAAADAAAHSAALVLLNDRTAMAQARSVAVALANTNIPDVGIVLAADDVTFGEWDSKTHQFTPGASPPNAVQAVVRRSSANENAVPLFFAPLLRRDSADVIASAIAMIPAEDGVQFRFLLDDEMIDSDVPSIEKLAQQQSVSPDDLITDGDGDGFIDLPPGVQVELPTGQQGDEGMFDRSSYDDAFPFRENTTYDVVDFLAEGTALQSELGTQPMQDVTWTSQNAPHPDLKGSKVLDPVLGVDPMDSHAAILDLPDPQATYVSPLSKSDVSMAERDPKKYGSPSANLQGERRGLIAFKILSARANPAGGSYLPLITIEVVDPKTIDLENLSAGGGSTKAKPVLVQ